MTSPLVPTPLGSTVHAVWLCQNNAVATNANSWRGPQELQTDCPICLVVLRKPFQVTCCGYSFCRTCIKPILTNKMACPTCNEASFNAFPNKGLQRVFLLCSVHPSEEWLWVIRGAERTGWTLESEYWTKQAAWLCVCCSYVYPLLQVLPASPCAISREWILLPASFQLWILRGL